MFYHNTLLCYCYYFEIIMTIESEGSESSEGFEKNASTSQYAYHIESENNRLNVAGKTSVSISNIEDILNQKSDIQFLSSISLHCLHSLHRFHYCQYKK